MNELRRISTTAEITPSVPRPAETEETVDRDRNPSKAAPQEQDGHPVLQADVPGEARRSASRG